MMGYVLAQTIYTTLLILFSPMLFFFFGINVAVIAVRISLANSPRRHMI